MSIGRDRVLQSSFLKSSQRNLCNGIKGRRLCSSVKLSNGFVYSNCSASFSVTKSDNQTGRFGIYGGKYVPELLISSLSRLEDVFYKALNDPEFQEEVEEGLRDYIGRETPLYYAKRLTEYHKNKQGKGPEIYLKREDLNHLGSHNMNNALAQSMLAKRMGCATVVTATSGGNHGLATAAACAKLGLRCTVVMGQEDIEKRPSVVGLMELLGAEVKQIEGNFKDASSEAVREWVGSLEESYYLPASVIGPHPCPMMVREFQSVIGKEVRRQAMEKWGGLPDVLVASVGAGSNAMGLFHEFREDEGVRLVGVEAAGCGLKSGRHSATLANGDVGVYHGTMSYLLQDNDGQILRSHSIALGLQSPGVGPELSYLKDSNRAEFHTATDEEALNAYRRLCRLEGIFPALEAAHALAFLEKLCPTLPVRSKVVVSVSGRGDIDAARVMQLIPNLHCNRHKKQFIDNMFEFLY